MMASFDIFANKTQALLSIYHTRWTGPSGRSIGFGIFKGEFGRGRHCARAEGPKGNEGYIVL